MKQSVNRYLCLLALCSQETGLQWQVSQVWLVSIVLIRIESVNLCGLVNQFGLQTRLQHTECFENDQV